MSQQFERLFLIDQIRPIVPPARILSDDAYLVFSIYAE